jgi:nucleoside-triphosphatase THEP1
MILILTGAVHAGKTTFLKNLLPVFRSRGIPAHGYLSLPVLKQGRTWGYDLFDFKRGRSVPFLRREGRPGWQRIGRFFFLPAALRDAEIIIRGCPSGEWLIVDEVGPQELAGCGVWPALSTALRRPELGCLLVARESLLDELLGLLGRRPVEVFDIAAEDTLSALLERLSKSAGK